MGSLFPTPYMVRGTGPHPFDMDDLFSVIFLDSESVSFAWATLLIRWVTYDEVSHDHGREEERDAVETAAVYAIPSRLDPLSAQDTEDDHERVQKVDEVPARYLALEFILGVVGAKNLPTYDAYVHNYVGPLYCPAFKRFGEIWWITLSHSIVKVWNSTNKILLTYRRRRVCSTRILFIEGRASN